LVLWGGIYWGILREIGKKADWLVKGHLTILGETFGWGTRKLGGLKETFPGKLLLLGPKFSRLVGLGQV